MGYGFNVVGYSGDVFAKAMKLTDYVEKNGFTRDSFHEHVRASLEGLDLLGGGGNTAHLFTVAAADRATAKTPEATGTHTGSKDRGILA